MHVTRKASSLASEGVNLAYMSHYGVDRRTCAFWFTYKVYTVVNEFINFAQMDIHGSNLVVKHA